MPDGIVNPLGGLAAQVQGLAEQRNSPEAAKLQFSLQQALAEQTRQNLGNQYLATADFSKDPAAALRTFGSILGNNDIIKASLDMSLKQRELSMHRERLQAELEKQQAEQLAKSQLGESLATGTAEDVARLAPLAGEVGSLRDTLTKRFATPEERTLEQQKITQGRLQAEQTKAITERTRAETEKTKKEIEAGPGEKPLTQSQKLTQIRGLKQEIESSKPVQEFKTIRRQVANVDAVLNDLNKDLTRGIKQETAILSFQKILDPISVVREGEFARTASGQGLLQRIDSAVNRAIGGGFVDDATIKSIQGLIRNFAANAQKYANDEISSRREVASSFGLDPDLVGKAFTDFEEQAPDSADNKPVGNAPATGANRFDDYIKNNKL